MAGLMQSSFLSLALLSACVGDPAKVQKDPREELLKTFCGKCPCPHMETDGPDITADCYPATEEDEHYGRSTRKI